jgi:predicted MFS family arabinose efflux permease
LVAAVVLGVLFVVIEARTAQPMLDLALLHNRAFVGTLIAGLLLTFAAFASFTYTSIWMQSVLGLSPIQAGLTGLPLSLASFVTSAMLGRVLHKAAPGPLIGGGLLLIGVGGVIGGLLVHGSASWPALLPGFFVIGIGVGMATPTLSSTAMSAVPVQRGGMAAGAVNTARQLGFAFGIAALGSVFATRAQSSLASHHVPAAGRVAQVVAGGQSSVLLRSVPASARSALEDALHAAAVSGVQMTLYVSAIAGLVAGVIVLALVRTRPQREPVAADAATGPTADPAPEPVG